ncbi:hypothetical protein TGME49_259000 [Toxoplasma gondii ME49]|uniref:ER membrane protein complex subunit 4 n=2 Tax=Toxoplasma gondii TaxID=5811 RepID=B6KBD0_TOXGV|nr:hypothetical protein TGME49_259000 [Toxoplasma gondii ME49]EPT29400.1 hypothetical protein TGME49_259000 [Toxoplasma gondii ME49]ESS32254.1 putative transmembrane protein [Toxoplasma gondii VEG]CEL74427.1 TPA: hypothetical protein BN1205_075440 [Toxoplasma gondii VEG]|eukprot:XP_002365114.1 hypothetical protein TGME49_259000 [Toxoplasma gondii ME49]
MEKHPADSADFARSCWTFPLDAGVSSARSRGNLPPPASLPSPPGFAFTESAASAAPAAASQSLPATSRVDAVRRQHLLAKKGWEIAISPAKNLAMNFFMIYMGGVNSSGIFGILILFYVLHSCFSSALSVRRVFGGIEQEREALRASSSSPSPSSSSSGDRRREAAQEANWSLGAVFFLQKTVYLLISLGGCLYVLNHCAKAGLLPLNSGDFIALIPEKRFSVVAVGGL